MRLVLVFLYYLGVGECLMSTDWENELTSFHAVFSLFLSAQDHLIS